MRILGASPFRMDNWDHASLDKFIGECEERLHYALGISPQDPRQADIYYLNVEITHTYVHLKNGIVLNAQGLQTFIITVPKSQTISPTEFFECVIRANLTYATEFHARTGQTNLMHNSIPPPKPDRLKDEIIKVLHGWENGVRYMSIS